MRFFWINKTFSFILISYVFLLPFLKGLFSKELFYPTCMFLLLLAIIYILKPKQQFFMDKKMTVLAILQFIMAAISIFTGVNREESFFGFFQTLFPFVFFMLLINLSGLKDTDVKTPTSVKVHKDGVTDAYGEHEDILSYQFMDRILVAIFIGGICISLFNFLVVSSLFLSSTTFIRFSAVIEYANTLAVYLFICTMIGFYLSQKNVHSSLWKMVIIKTGIFLNSTSVILTHSRKMWILSVLLYTLLVILYKNKRVLCDVLLLLLSQYFLLL